MGLPNIGSKFARKRIRKKYTGASKGRRIKSRKVISKTGSALNHGRSAARNSIIAFTDPGR
jgi:hypothetical protein